MPIYSLYITSDNLHGLAVLDISNVNKTLSHCITATRQHFANPYLQELHPGAKILVIENLLEDTDAPLPTVQMPLRDAQVLAKVIFLPIDFGIVPEQVAFDF